MKINISSNYKWIDILPSLIVDWNDGENGRDLEGGIKVYIGWIYWTITWRITGYF